MADPISECQGHRYINLDSRRFEHGEPSLIGDAHRLPFKDATLDMVVSKDTLEHFLEPWVAVKEVHRVLKEGGGSSSGFRSCTPSMGMIFIVTARWDCGIC
jgi:ubiquinone/menaquinone biosynthesis C-methylase UbiE